MKYVFIKFSLLMGILATISCGTSKKLESANAQIQTLNSQVDGLNKQVTENQKLITELKEENISALLQWEIMRPMVSIKGLIG